MRLLKGNIVLLLCMLVGNTIYSQPNLLDRKISIRFEDHTVDAALKKLMKEADCSINFKSSDLPKDRLITKYFQQTSIRIIIKEIWGSEGLGFLAIGNKITIKVLPKKVIKSEKGILQGRVTDDKGEWLTGATVQQAETNIGDITDVEGRFK